MKSSLVVVASLVVSLGASSAFAEIVYVSGATDASFTDTSAVPADANATVANAVSNINGPPNANGTAFQNEAEFTLATTAGTFAGSFTLNLAFSDSNEVVNNTLV